MGLDRWSIQSRPSELSRKGLIWDSGRRRLNATGKQAIVWIANRRADDATRASQPLVQQSRKPVDKEVYANIILMMRTPPIAAAL